MIEVYKKCRTKEEIDIYFKQLEEEFKDTVDKRIKDVQSILFENFEGSVINKLRLTYSDTKTFLEKFERWLWEITRYYLETLADFESEDYTFTFKNNGDRFTMNKLRTDAKHYRIQSDIAQNLIKKAKAEKTEKSHLIFDLASSPIKYNELNQLRGYKGIMKISNLEVQSDIEQHDTLILTGLVNDGRVISEENIRNLFSLTAHIDKFRGADQDDLKKQHQKIKKIN